jgi:predicted phage terminase large subunit-like protein
MENLQKAHEKQRNGSVADAVERELIRRELARRHLLRFIQRFHKDYQAGWVHRLVCSKLELFMQDVIDGRQPRLMFFMPPRTGKSLIVSNYFPAWVLGHHPEFEIIAASYGSSLPMKFSRFVRGMLRDKAYQEIFSKTRLDRNNENVEGWETTQGGGYIPAGVGGGITGKGAHILSIDDPIKDAEEADSDTIKESVWDWWGSTAYTRLAPNSGALLTQTRWADDDLAGRILQQQADNLKSLEAEESVFRNQYQQRKEQMIPEEFERWEARYNERLDEMRDEIDNWETVNFPAIAEEDEFLTPDFKITYEEKPEYTLLRRKGDALHPDRYPRRRLMAIKKTLQPRHWAALYQQKPMPDEGVYFTKDMLRIEMPEPDWRRFTLAQAWDLAIGKKETNDFTVGTTGGLDYENNVHILRVARRRVELGEMATMMIDEYDRFRQQPQLVGIEKDKLELALRPELSRQMKKRNIYMPLAEGNYALKPVTDKIVRARPLQGRMQQGTVLLPGYSELLDEIKHELLRFPGGIHDDIVDSMAWLIRLLSFLAPPKKPKKAKHESWRDKLKKVVIHGTSQPKDPMAA